MVVQRYKEQRWPSPTPEGRKLPEVGQGRTYTADRHGAIRIPFALYGVKEGDQLHIYFGEDGPEIEFKRRDKRPPAQSMPELRPMQTKTWAKPMPPQAVFGE